MKSNKRIIGILVSLSLVLGTSNIAFAATNTTVKETGKAVPSQELAYLKPSFAVQVKDKMQVFKNVKGQRVYPIVYNGSTYLPVRAISALMGEDIEWDNYSKTVFIGKTLSNPNKSKAKKDNENQAAAKSVDKNDYVVPTWKSDTVTVSVKPDISIMYDFEPQIFKDADGNRMYPIVYEGSTYLPIRAISSLMKETIEWDNITKTVIIAKPPESVTEEAIKVTANTKRLTAEFEGAVELYDAATAKVSGIQKCTESAMLVMLADSISADVKEAEKQTISINSMRKSAMTEEEKVAHTALYEFARISEYYLLVLENIAYLAASEKDYSMLSETFLNMALDSQAKMNNARSLIEDLPQ